MARVRDAKGRFTPSNGEHVSNQMLSEMMYNEMTTRSRLLQKLFDPRRDINDECGYPRTEDIRTREYREMYDREGVAARVVEVFPRESWIVQPRVFETEDQDVNTEFEKAWEEVQKSLRPKSWYKPQEEKGSLVWEMLRRGDELSGVGSFGILLIGLDDGRELDQPAVKRKDAKVLFVRAFDENLVDILNRETDRRSPRFGHPTLYNVSFDDPNMSGESIAGMGTQLATQRVHWTRVIHLADNLGSSEIFGVPRMRPVWNRLLDIRKLYGGSAEMYWRGAFFGLSFETHPGLGGNVTVDSTKLKDQIEQYMNGLQRYLTTKGMTANSLAPQVVDPSPQIDVQIDAICVKLGIPKRIFLGSERGELASSQDAGAWNDRMRFRQEDYITPRIIVPFIDRLIELGVLPEPKEYSVEWPDLEALSEQEQADIAAKRTEAMAKYVGGNVEGLMEPLDWLIRILGLDPEEAESVIEAAMEHEEEVEEKDAEKREEQGDQFPPPVPPPQGGQPPQPGQQPPPPKPQAPPQPTQQPRS